MNGYTNGDVYIQWNIIQSLKKEIPPSATMWMNPKNVMLSEIR
jgi:hypothetical protein